MSLGVGECFPLSIRGGEDVSYVIIYIKQKTKKEDLKNEYTLED